MGVTRRQLVGGVAAAGAAGFVGRDVLAPGQPTADAAASLPFVSTQGPGVKVTPPPGWIARKEPALTSGVDTPECIAFMSSEPVPLQVSATGDWFDHPWSYLGKRGVAVAVVVQDERLAPRQWLTPAAADALAAAGIDIDRASPQGRPLPRGRRLSWSDMGHRGGGVETGVGVAWFRSPPHEVGVLIWAGDAATPSSLAEAVAALEF